VVHAPHSHHSRTSGYAEQSRDYRVTRFHYFWPFRLERLAGRGILPTLKANRFFYLQVPFLVLFQILSLLRLVRRERPDLLYAHWFCPQAISTAIVAKLTRTPFVFTTHASDVTVLGYSACAKALVKWVCSQAAAYTAVSTRTADKLRSMFGDEEWSQRYSAKLSVIPMGVNTAEQHIDPGALTRIKSRYSIDGSKEVILFIGRLAEKKGVEYLLEAFSLLPPSLRGRCQLIIAGDGYLRPRLETRASALGLKDVVFTGFVQGEDKAALFSLARVLCIPSIVDGSGDSEGFPVVLMEGLASGKIVLASDASGAETVLVNGKSGFLFAQKSAAELAGALRH